MMKFGFLCLFTLGLVVKTSAFALLGPFESWQTPYLGYNVTGDEIGGPKNIGEEYRWNVPVITYGFDPSFEEYFGKPGIAAVQAAFDLLNEIPAASQIVVTNFQIISFAENSRATFENLIDVKTASLSIVLQILGLISPENNVWTLRDRTITQSSTNYYVIQRNFDPITWLPSKFINGNRYSYEVHEFWSQYYNYFGFADAVEWMVNPEGGSTLAGFLPKALYWRNQYPVVGTFFFGFNQDDLGGLRYLFHPLNINYERHRYDQVHALDGSSSFVNAALRPGIDKITFQQVTNWYGNIAWSKSIQFTDNYYLNGQLYTQELVRTINKPDIIFAAHDTGTVLGGRPRLVSTSMPTWDSPAIDSGTPGPGTISGPITLTFNTLLGGLINTFPGNVTEENSYTTTSWGTFDLRPLSPIVFPYSAGSEIQCRLLITDMLEDGRLVFGLVAYPNISFIVESSPDLVHWSEEKRVSASATTGGISFTLDRVTTKAGFYRVRPE
jgi:hypothetical protein